MRYLLEASYDDYRAATERLVSYMMACKQPSNPTWYLGLEDELNQWAESVGYPERVEIQDNPRPNGGKCLSVHLAEDA